MKPVIIFVIFVVIWAAFQCGPAFGQTPEQAAEILRNLDSPTNATDRQYLPRSLPRVRHVVVPRTVAPAAPAPVKRRLDGTRLDRPPLVYGFTPHDWQWWYQQEIHREVR